VPAVLAPRRLGLLAGAAIVLLLAIAGPAAAADPAGANITGPCTVTAASSDASGSQLDTLTGPATSDPNNPFDVDPAGTVTWSGTGPAITTGTYQLTIYGLPVWSGDIDNAEGKTSADGVLDLAEILSVVPVDLVGVVEVSGSVSGTGGSCSGSAWIKLGGDPVTSVPGLVGLGAGIIGLLGVLSAFPGRHPGRGLLFGLVLGLGAGVLAVVFGVLPLGSLSPVVALAGGGLIGLVAGWLPFGGGAAV
jgi:hypothetical protein